MFALIRIDKRSLPMSSPFSRLPLCAAAIAFFFCSMRR
jgi:hypothetical protein